MAPQTQAEKDAARKAELEAKAAKPRSNVGRRLAVNTTVLTERGSVTLEKGSQVTEEHAGLITNPDVWESDEDDS